MRKLIALIALICLGAQPVLAGPWLVGAQPVTYDTYPHILGDNSNARGGEAPYFASNEPADIASNFTVTDWIHNPPGGQYDAPGSGASEAKARFDCNTAFAGGKNDPIINPGVLGGGSHKHNFIGNTGAAAAPHNATYASLRASGYSTCYGGPLNRSLYWEPAMLLTVNGQEIEAKPHNLITYYGSPGGLDPAKTALVTRWGRGWNVIGGFNMADPTDSAVKAEITAANTAHGNTNISYVTNGFIGWMCNGGIVSKGAGAAFPGSTSTMEPYLADATGQPTLNCVTQTIANFGTGVLVRAEINAPWCWDGKNPTSPNGRAHMRYLVRDGRNPTSAGECPDNWYRIAFFNVIVEFAFKSNAEMATAHLSSDRMDANPANWFRNGETMHFDFMPAWDYGTGNSPGVMVKFFQKCAGISMHLKNNDGVTYTDLTGDPHECDYGRVSATEQIFVNENPPAGNAGSPSPITNLSPDITGTNRFFPIKSGESTTGSVIHTH